MASADTIYSLAKMFTDVGMLEAAELFYRASHMKLSRHGGNETPAPDANSTHKGAIHGRKINTTRRIAKGKRPTRRK